MRTDHKTKTNSNTDPVQVLCTIARALVGMANDPAAAMFADALAGSLRADANGGLRALEALARLRRIAGECLDPGGFLDTTYYRRTDLRDGFDFRPHRTLAVLEGHDIALPAPDGGDDAGWGLVKLLDAVSADSVTKSEVEDDLIRAGFIDGPNLFREFELVLSSEAYGSESFGPYDGADEAAAGLRRLITKYLSLADGIDRTLAIDIDCDQGCGRPAGVVEDEDEDEDEEY